MIVVASCSTTHESSAVQRPYLRNQDVILKDGKVTQDKEPFKVVRKKIDNIYYSLKSHNGDRYITPFSQTEVYLMPGSQPDSLVWKVVYQLMPAKNKKGIITSLNIHGQRVPVEKFSGPSLTEQDYPEKFDIISWEDGVFFYILGFDPKGREDVLPYVLVDTSKVIKKIDNETGKITFISRDFLFPYKLDNLKKEQFNKSINSCTPVAGGEKAIKKFSTLPVAIQPNVDKSKKDVSSKRSKPISSFSWKAGKIY